MFSGALFDRLEVGGSGRVTREQFNAFWVERLAGADTAARAYEVLRRPGVGHITHADVKPLMRDLLVRLRAARTHACHHRAVWAVCFPALSRTSAHPHNNAHTLPPAAHAAGHAPGPGLFARGA
jgi:hypothetical protein